MTTTTAKQIIGRLPRLLPLAAALLVVLPAQAQWRVTPSLSITETFTDNANRGSTNRNARLITEVMPGISAYGQNRWVQGSVNASASLFGYIGGGRGTSRRNRVQYDAAGRLKVIDEFMYVDASARSSTQAISAFGLLGKEARYSNENVADVSTWSISPNINQRFGNFAYATLRYTLNGVEADRSRYGSSTAHGPSFTLASGRSWEDLGWNLSYARQDVDNKQFPDSASENAKLRLNYRLNRTLRLTASGGYDSYDFNSLGGRTEGKSWSAGFDWRPTGRTRLDVEAGRHFLGKTGALLASHRSRHTVTSLTYSDNVTTTRAQFALPTALDTAGMLDSLFAVTIPDAFARREAIDAYLRVTGLPPTLIEEVNYLTNRYFRQKQARASMVYNWSTHSTVLSAFASERVVLSTGEADNSLVGSELFALNNNVRQVGFNIAHSYRLNTKTSATAGLTATRSRNLDTDIVRSQQTLSMGMRQIFSRKMQGVVELRHARGEHGLTSRHYYANSISATLSAEL
ncbi:TIGR03016 family PEP-CTERM system-associated outer membrane protein [Massilia niabensis]|uniref:TIGR03016 family PEP-CTERM system-associated outer membrane protein n=1 Tax=Massilia niabensis TaxID=544910 RepID=A0ABW0L3D6_9BURK